MNNNKQSSVEWLICELINQEYKNPHDTELINIIEQAKAMHKQEIINAVNSCGYIGGATDEETEQYYKEKFGDNNDKYTTI